MAQLRDYQQSAHDKTIDFIDNNSGHLVLKKPTGSGKSHVIAAIVKTLTKERGKKVLMLTHVKELIQQNYEKLKQHWPSAPAGIYSAGVGRKELDERITYGGIQSLRTKAKSIGHQDFIIIDECHMINNKKQGGYRDLIDSLIEINPNIRIIGLSATPYRLGQGLLTEGEDALFSEIIEPVTIEELVKRGFLATLRSKCTEHVINVDNVKKRGGEYIESQLQQAVNTDHNNIKIIEETLKRAGDRKAWLFFCAGVEHAQEMADILNMCGINTTCLTGKHTKAQRDMIIQQYKDGYYKALTNANVLTTGFDYPDIDLIVFARPTLSPALYVQMAGRGMRLKSHTDHCLVLDFAGNVSKHGPITSVREPKKKGDKVGDAVMKACPECHELLYAFQMNCTCCGYEFEKQEKTIELKHDDIMGIEPSEMGVTRWSWAVHVGRNSGKTMLKCKYYGALNDYPITEYLNVMDDGKSGSISLNKLYKIANQCGAVNVFSHENLESVAKELNACTPPEHIFYKINGKFRNVTRRIWPTKVDSYPAVEIA